MLVSSTISPSDMVGTNKKKFNFVIITTIIKEEDEDKEDNEDYDDEQETDQFDLSKYNTYLLEANHQIILFEPSPV